jgi:hypothetical protein
MGHSLVQGNRQSANLFVVLCCLGLFGCGVEPDYFRNATVPSPSGRLLADWYARLDGGPVGSSEDRVVIHDSQQQFSTELAYVFSGISADNLKIVWTSETELTITYPKNTSVTKALGEWNGIRISYTMDPLMSRKR